MIKCGFWLVKVFAPKRERKKKKKKSVVVKSYKILHRDRRRVKKKQNSHSSVWRKNLYREDFGEEIWLTDFWTKPQSFYQKLKHFI